MRECIHLHMNLWMCASVCNTWDSSKAICLGFWLLLFKFFVITFLFIETKDMVFLIRFLVNVIFLAYENENTNFYLLQVIDSRKESKEWKNMDLPIGTWGQSCSSVPSSQSAYPLQRSYNGIQRVKSHENSSSWHSVKRWKFIINIRFCWSFILGSKSKY